jgi:hypothetical protein
MTDSESAQEAEIRLMDMLPRGYAADACEAVVPPEGVSGHAIPQV